MKLVSPPKKVTKNTAPPSSKSSKSTFKSTTPAQISSKSGWIWPVKGPILKRFSAKAGNKGIDIGGESGRGIRAAADGKVVYAGSGLRGYGKLIIVKHDEVYLSAYAHNSKLLVADGSAVVRGQQIALMGDTGTDRVKLHFEIRQRGKPVNPLKYLPKRP
ncbi:MAG: peptidoglycan DD-metalloendopeptidase family protein [Arenicellales bacterium]|nr:peptidoglycan DD-metalloendopeptidase family protein [Arenicellales bacterium]